MATTFELALSLTREEHNHAFERFANAFLVHDYPELEALGGKHDGAIDARLFSSSTGALTLIVQSCVSPRDRAKAKILGTIATLEKRGTLPPTFVYCTSAILGDSLDELKRDLRTSKHVALELCDASWLQQRELTKGRGELCSRYSADILAPISVAINRDTLYAGILSEEQQRLAFQYLEAQRLDHRSGGNITKRTFSALVLYVLKEHSSASHPMNSDNIVSAIQALFPNGTHHRVREIVLGRIGHLENKRMIHFNKQVGTYVLSSDESATLTQHLSAAQGIDARFRVAVLRQIDLTCDERQIDYDFDRNELAELAHKCVLWHMKNQADRFLDPFRSVTDVIYADKLVVQYIEQSQGRRGRPKKCDAATDILPHALYAILSSRDIDVQGYLRSKADLLILQAFLQVTPDVYDACRNLIGRDIIYLDASALIRCVAELFSPGSGSPLIAALRHARTLNTKLRVLRPHIDELVSHLRGPVLLEWKNHMAGLSASELEPRLWSAPTLIKVFHSESIRRCRTFESLVEEVIGHANEWENAKEFLVEELNVKVEEIEATDDNEWRQSVFGIWLDKKRKSPRLSDSRFELLVRNDVNAFSMIVQQRKRLQVAGDNYGQKVWLLTFDSMYWRIPALLGEKSKHLYHVGMSMDYLIQYVSTAAQAGMVELPGGVLPATLLLDESDTGGAEFRDIVIERWDQPGEKRYMRERRLRDLVHELKGARPEAGLDDGFEAEAEFLEPVD